MNLADILIAQDPSKSYRVLNLGATTLIGAQHEGEINYMAAAWAGAVDFDKGYCIIDKAHFTRHLIEESGKFLLCYPSAAIAQTVMQLGTISKRDDKDKLAHASLQLENFKDLFMPIFQGCVAYLEYEVIKEPHNELMYDMFIGKCTKVYADKRVYSDNHWHFENADPSLRTLHYVAGGHFYALGEHIHLKQYDE